MIDPVTKCLSMEKIFLCLEKNLNYYFCYAQSLKKFLKREFILESVWGKDVVVGDRTIDVHIRKLREKIGDSYFKTVKGVGYKFQN